MLPSDARIDDRVVKRLNRGDCVISLRSLLRSTVPVVPGVVISSLIEPYCCIDDDDVNDETGGVGGGGCCCWCDCGGMNDGNNEDVTSSSSSFS